MSFKIEKKLVVAIASSALFDLSVSDLVFREKGEDVYRQYQREHQKDVLSPGVAFSFIKRLLNLNLAFPDLEPVEVVLLSKNDPDTGLRVFNSIKAYSLLITRGSFLNGKPPYQYMPAFNAALFLSANPNDVRDAINAGQPAGTVLRTNAKDDPNDRELRVAFDFDGVIVDDEAEKVYKAQDLNKFQQTELDKGEVPHKPGPLSDLFKKLAVFQILEHRREKKDPTYKRVLRTAIITARNAPAHERVVTTLRAWGVTADETFFLGGIEKKRILEILKPHIFFDDQMDHLKSAAETIPSVHIPFGISNIM
jgi:5'-nucleotidase